MLALSSILSAVKPRDRSDQFLVLAAMYSLDAHSKAVTARQVIDVLRLHLGGKIPRNVNDTLRKSGGCVDPVEKALHYVGLSLQRVCSSSEFSVD